MTFRTMVLPLGFGLSAVLCALPAAAEEDPPPAPRPPVRVYTNEDLDRVHALRDQTGVHSVPAVPPEERSAPARAEKARGHGEEHWRREATRVRERVRAMQAQAADLRASIAAQADEAAHFLSGRRRSSASLSGNAATSRLQSRLAALERRIREMEEDLAERARRDGALPGWLRP
jgi:septal ring factor EnvC (AmiA/AmiB activator)